VSDLRDRRASRAVPRAAAPAQPAAPALRARIAAVLRPIVLGEPTAGAGAPLTARRVAATARDAAAAVLPLLGSPRRSAERVRRLVTPVLVCGWAEFDAEYAAALDAIVALPPAVPGVDDPAWDAGLPPEPAPPREWSAPPERRWTPPEYGAEGVGPAGTVGRVVRRGATAVLLTGDGRLVRLRARCACAPAARRARGEVPFEQVHLRRDGSVLDVTVGTACGLCRAPVE
jgi:hypothetical protein